MNPEDDRFDDATSDAAVAWLIRRDRGLSAAEQDEFLQWRRANPRHAAAFAHHETAFQRMMQLGDWKPLFATEPNPDLFGAPLRPGKRHPVRRAAMAIAMAAAVAVAAGALFWRDRGPAAEPADAPRAYLRVNERQVLADGSLVELKDGSRIDVEYSAHERRVRLLDGEAHFIVAKNADRPFVVEAHGVAVRAVGTAFNVRLDAAAVEVLVTEGRVQVGADEPEKPAVDAPPAIPTAGPATTLEAGQRSVVPVEARRVAPAVEALTPAEVKTALGWQTPRLQFHETPLGQAVAEFNRHAAAGSERRLVVEDPALAKVAIGGTFRLDNVDAFVRLLEYTLGVRALPRGTSELVLTRGR